MRKDEKEARRIVRERSDGRCEVCGQARATNYQHRKNRSQCLKAELWKPSNGLDVCGSGTTGCHGDIHRYPTLADSNGWTVLSWEDPGEKPVKLYFDWVKLDDAGDFTGLCGEPA